MTTTKIDLLGRHSGHFATWLRNRYAPSTVHSTLTDIATLSSCIHEERPVPLRLRTAARRLLTWAATQPTNEPKQLLDMAAQLCAPRPRKTHRMRSKEERAAETPRFELTRHQRDRIKYAATAPRGRTGGSRRSLTPAENAIATLAELGWSVSNLFERQRRPGQSWAEYISPRGKRMIGAGGAYQKLRRAWPKILTEARKLDASIPETLTLRDLELR